MQRDAQFLDERDPVRPRRFPRARTVGEGELFVVEVDADGVVLVGEVEDRGDVLLARHRVGDDRRHPAGGHVVADRRDDVGAVDAVEEHVDLVLLGLVVDPDVVDADRLVPERRQLTDDLEPFEPVGRDVVERPVRHPHVDRHGAGRRLGTFGWIVRHPPRTADDERRHDRQHDQEDAAVDLETRAGAVAARPAAARPTRRFQRFVEQRAEVFDPDRFERVDERDARARLGRLHVRHREHPAAGGERGAGTGRRVLDGDAITGVGAAHLGTQQVRRRVRLALALRNLVAGDHTDERAVR